jgi:hypothetical protein
LLKIEGGGWIAANSRRRGDARLRTGGRAIAWPLGVERIDAGVGPKGEKAFGVTQIHRRPAYTAGRVSASAKALDPSGRGFD